MTGPFVSCPRCNGQPQMTHATLWVDASPYGISAVSASGDTRWMRSPNTGHSVIDEVHAVRLALEWLAGMGAKTATVLCDSTEAVKAIHDDSYAPTGPKGLAVAAGACRYELQPGWVVAWIPRAANAAANAAARRKRIPHKAERSLECSSYLNQEKTDG
jgi:ribonuclease HI